MFWRRCLLPKHTRSAKEREPDRTLNSTCFTQQSVIPIFRNAHTKKSLPAAASHILKRIEMAKVKSLIRKSTVNLKNLILENSLEMETALQIPFYSHMLNADGKGRNYLILLLVAQPFFGIIELPGIAIITVTAEEYNIGF